MNKEMKKKLMNEFAQSENDTGSIELQVALLTNRIQGLMSILIIIKKTLVQKEVFLKW